MRYHPMKTTTALIIFVMAIFTLASVGQAAEITLAWNPHEFSRGYNIYYKAGSSVQADPKDATPIYIAVTDPGFDADNPSYTVTELENDTRYFFVVTAMVDGVESGMSNEVSVTNGGGSTDNENTGTSSESSGAGGCFITSLK